MDLKLGQRVLVHAEVKAAYDHATIRARDPTWLQYKQYRAKENRTLVEEGWKPVHVPNGIRVRGLYRREVSPYREGIIIGYVFRQTGNWEAGFVSEDDDVGPYLSVDKRHRVWLVTTMLRWCKPLEALEADLEIVEEG